MEFYRYELRSYCSMETEPCSPKYSCSLGSFSHTKLELNIYNLIKETPKGYWIAYGNSYFYGNKRWISKTSRKRYAYPTKEEALINYIKRTEYRMKILQNQLYNCEDGLKLAEKEKNNL